MARNSTPNYPLQHVGKSVTLIQNIKGGYTEYEDYTLEQKTHEGEIVFQVYDFFFTASQVTKFRATPSTVRIEVTN